MERDFQIAGGPTLTPEERVRQHALVAAPPQTNRAGRWQDDMSPADVAEFEAVAGELMAELGYELAVGLSAARGGDSLAPVAGT